MGLHLPKDPCSRLKKWLTTSSISLIPLIFTTIFLTVIGYETNKFNSLLEKKIIEKEPNLNIDLDKIKIKFNPKKLSFFITTHKPEVKYRNIRLDLSKIDAYVNLRSLITGSQ